MMPLPPTPEKTGVRRKEGNWFPGYSWLDPLFGVEFIFVLTIDAVSGVWSFLVTTAVSLLRAMLELGERSNC
jgi:hypothetical protein